MFVRRVAVSLNKPGQQAALLAEHSIWMLAPQPRALVWIHWALILLCLLQEESWGQSSYNAWKIPSPPPPAATTCWYGDVTQRSLWQELRPEGQEVRPSIQTALNTTELDLTLLTGARMPGRALMVGGYVYCTGLGCVWIDLWRSVSQCHSKNSLDYTVTLLADNRKYEKKKSLNML